MLIARADVGKGPADVLADVCLLALEEVVAQRQEAEVDHGLSLVILASSDAPERPQRWQLPNMRVRVRNVNTHTYTKHEHAHNSGEHTINNRKSNGGCCTKGLDSYQEQLQRTNKKKLLT